MPTTTPDLLIDTAAGVCTLTFNRLDKKNAFTPAMYAAMADALEQGAQDATVRVVVIQGECASAATMPARSPPRRSAGSKDD